MTTWHCDWCGLRVTTSLDDEPGGWYYNPRLGDLCVNCKWCLKDAQRVADKAARRELIKEMQKARPRTSGGRPS